MFIEYSIFTLFVAGRFVAVHVIVVEDPTQNDAVVFGAVTVIAGNAIVKLTSLISEKELLHAVDILILAEVDGICAPIGHA